VFDGGWQPLEKLAKGLHKGIEIIISELPV
jgi:hypothetical protein